MITTLAPCGMNCELCHSFQDNKKKCPGCRNRQNRCVIRNCQKREVYCFECPEHPCRRLKQLDVNYQTNYSMSMLENLAYIKEYGETAFLRQQKDKYTCPDCGKFYTVHQDHCIYCKQEKRK